QGTKGFTEFGNAKISNYETDVFRPLFAELEKLSGRNYGSTLPEAGTGGHSEQEKIDIAFRVIADHARTLSFAVADGISPGNNDRNYVLRRILRRAVRYGRTLGFHEPFFYKLTAVLAHTMGDVFPELRAKLTHVEQVIKGEEEAFNRTLDKGIALFEAEADRLGPSGRLSGAFAFRLYDEQGFPLDLTELMARERGLSVDTAGFGELMEEQRSRARAAQKKQIITVSEIATKEPTRFTGYEDMSVTAKVSEIVDLTGKLAVVLEASTCYAEMGGQVGDTGELRSGSDLWRIANTQKAGDVWLHVLQGDDAPAAGQEVQLCVDADRRAAIERHHTVTHLLHWALHETVSREAVQKGSYVGPDKLTFDFSSAALTPEQISSVERLVNAKILENAPVSWSDVAYADVRGRDDVMQFFGDKYGDRVRVVQIGGAAGALDGYSMELCGGTHVRGTGEIGLFRITGEGAVAAGIRRIEAVAGEEARRAAESDRERLKTVAAKLGSPLGDLEKKLDAFLAQQKETEKALRSARQREAVSIAAQLAAKAETIAGIPVVAAHLGEADGDALQSAADALKAKFDGVIVLGGVAHGAVALVAAVGQDHAARVSAGKIIQAIAPVVGGRGGGKADNARGGGKDASKLADALNAAREFIAKA
ncbi:MAG: alanine--tRNA ligase, partial [Chthoniobacterales bacterium]